jgi:WD40 repeat protein
VILWDLIEGKPSATLHGHVAARASPSNGDEGIKDLAFTPDGKILVTGSSDGTIEFWDVASAVRQRTLPRLGDRLECLALSAGGKILATGNVDGTVNIWDTATGNQRRRLTGHVGRVEDIAFGVADEIVTGSSDGSLGFWQSNGNAHSENPLAILQTYLGVLSVAIAPRGNALAAGHAGGPITLWYRTRPMTRCTLAGHSQDVLRMVFAPDGATLASASLDGTIKLWDVATGRQRCSLDAHRSGALALAYSTDGQMLASGGRDQQIRLWEMSRLAAPASTSDKTPAPAMIEPPRVPQACPGETAAIAQIKRLGGRFVVQGCKSSWSPDGKRLVFGDGGRLKILELGTGRVHVLTQPGKDPAWSLADGRHIAYVVGDDQSEEVWVIEATGGAARRLARGGFPSWSADAKTVFLHSRTESKLQSIRLDKKDARVNDELGAAWPYPAISANGRRVAYRMANQLVVVDRSPGPSAARATTCFEWPLSRSSGCLPGWSPDGKYLGFGGQGNGDLAGLWIVDIARRQAVKVVGGAFTMPAWSPDGSKLTCDLRLGTSNEIWLLETKNLESLDPLAPASICSSVPEAAAELIGPLHRANGKLTYVDLKRHANVRLVELGGPMPGNDLGQLPRGEQTFAGVSFRIEDAAIQLASTKLRSAPVKVEGVPIHRRVIMFYILHAAQWTGAQFGVADGITLGQYRVHYADGSEATIPIVCGEDVRDWWSYENTRFVTRGQVAWSGRNEAARQNHIYLRLYLTAWENPQPEKSVASVDYASSMTAAAPFCVAMTVEEPGPAAAPPSARLPESRR